MIGSNIKTKITGIDVRELKALLEYLFLKWDQGSVSDFSVSILNCPKYNVSLSLRSYLKIDQIAVKASQDGKWVQVDIELFMGDLHSVQTKLRRHANTYIKDLTNILSSFYFFFLLPLRQPTHPRPFKSIHWSTFTLIDVDLSFI